MRATTHRLVTELQPYRLPARPTLRARLIRTLALWRRRWRERQALLAVDDREWRELGLSRWEIEQEVSKPFWRA